MATGKTNSKHIRVFVDDTGGTVRHVSAAVTNVTGVGLTHQETDVTGYSDGIINFTLGHPSSEIEITGPLDNTAAAASPTHSGPHIVFSALNGNQAATSTLTIQIGIRAAPVSGDPEFEGEYYCSSYVVNGDGTYTARMVPASGTAPAWGTVS